MTDVTRRLPLFVAVEGATPETDGARYAAGRLNEMWQAGQLPFLAQSCGSDVGGHGRALALMTDLMRSGQVAEWTLRQGITEAGETATWLQVGGVAVDCSKDTKTDGRPQLFALAADQFLASAGLIEITVYTPDDVRAGRYEAEQLDQGES